MSPQVSARPEPYCGPAPLPETLLAAWTFDPVLLAGLVAAGLAGLWQVARTGHAAQRRALGVATAAGVVAFVSPLCALTVALFAARGLHHLLLIFALAPALAVLRPLRLRAGAGLPALVGLSAALWAWHVPAVYAAAWDHAAVYWALQAALIWPAWAFWSGLLDPKRDVASSLSGALQLAALAGQMGLIGAILTFAPRPLYPEHLVHTEAFGLTPLADQQLAGLVMWVPGMVPAAVAAGWMLHRAWKLSAAATGRAQGAHG